MTSPQQPPAALPIAYVALRILIIVNWAGAAAILILLGLSPNEQWIMAAFKLAPSPDTTRLIWGLRTIAVLGVVGAPLNYVVLRQLLAMVNTVRAGDPFVPANAQRLRHIAYALIGLQLLSLTVAAVARAVSTPAHPLNFKAGFSVNAWLAILITLLLARVFEEGTRLRDDLAGTV